MGVKSSEFEGKHQDCLDCNYEENAKDYEKKEGSVLNSMGITWHRLKESRFSKKDPDYRQIETFEFEKQGEFYCFEDKGRVLINNNDRYVVSDLSGFLFKIYDKDGNVLFQEKVKDRKSRYNTVTFPYSEKAFLAKAFLFNALTGEEKYLDEIKLIPFSQVKGERMFYKSCYRGAYWTRPF